MFLLNKLSETGDTLINRINRSFMCHETDMMKEKEGGEVMRFKRIVVLALICSLFGAFHVAAATDNSQTIFNALESYESRASWDDSVPRLDWKANEASMKILTVLAHEVDVDGSSSYSIDSADDSYQSRLSWDDSVPRLDWKANEANVKLLTIIAHELDPDGSSSYSIDSADDSYQSRLSWDDSVPRLEWKANEAKVKLLQIIAHELDPDGSRSYSIDSADDSYQSRLSWDDSVPRLNWKANEASMDLLEIIAGELDVLKTYTSSIGSADDSYQSRLSWDDSVPRLNWKANEASMYLAAICALTAGDYIDSISGSDEGQQSASASVTVSAGTVKVLSPQNKTAAFTKAKNKKSISVPATVEIAGRTYKVTQINANAFTGTNIRTVTIGKNVKVIKKNAFKGSKATKLIMKTKLLKKSKVKGSLNKSRINTIQIKVSSKKSVNKKYKKLYKKYFVKSNSGRKVKTWR